MKGIEEKQIEAPYELPEGWKWCRLGEVAEIIMGQSPAGTSMTENQNDIAFIGGASDMGEELPNISRYTSEPTKLSKRDDVIVCIRATLGRPIFSDGIYCLGRGVAGIRSETLMKEYIKYGFLNFEQYLYDKATGSTFLQVSSKYLNEMPFPLPPTLAEQQRIVNRIESMFAKLDEAKEKAQNVVDGFETRKVAILHKAFTGELTAKWRKENNPEESSKYLEKIKDKVEIRLDFKYWENTKLPESWCESTIGNLLYFAGRVGWKGLKAEEYTSEGPILLSVYNLNDGDEVSFNKINHITNERYDESPEIMVRKNDILLTKDGAGIGKLGYVNELPEKATINSSLLLIRPGDVANYKFIFYLLSGPALQNIVKERITGSATPHLFQRDIKEFVLPVPSLPEQQEIVRILDTVLEKESRAKEAAQTVLDQIALLKKSILARAFRGEL